MDGLTVFFSQLGVPAILIAAAVFLANEERRSLAFTLVGVTVAHFAWQPFWTHMVAHQHDTTLVIGSLQAGTFYHVGLQFAAHVAHVWIGFANYSPIAQDQIAFALRWMIGGVA